MPSLVPILAKAIPNFYSCSTSGDQQLSRCTILKDSTNMPYSGSLTPAFPLAQILTTASSTVISNSSNNPWYQLWHGGGGAAVGGVTSNESEENIINNRAEIPTCEGAILKTTAIEQSFSDSRTPSPRAVDPMAMSKI